MKRLSFQRTFYNSIGFRLFITAVVFICIISVVFTSLAIRHDIKSHTEELKEKGHLLAKLFAYNSRLGVFSQNQIFLKNLIEGLLQQEDIISAAVFEPDGSILLMLDQPQEKGTETSHDLNRQHFVKVLELLKHKPEPYYDEWNEMFEFWAPVLADTTRAAREELILDNDMSPRSERAIGFVRLVYGKAALDRKLRELLVKNIFWGVFFLMLGSFISYLVAGRITRPLNKLTWAVAAFGEGSIPESGLPDGKDEIGRLGAAFKEMQTALMKREETLMELNARLQREIAENIRLQQDTLRAAQLASIGELAAGVAHEINTPINSIINCAQLLMDEQGASNSSNNYAQVIMGEGGRIAGIVKNLLSFARDRKEDKQPVEIREMISVVFDLAGTQLRKDGVNVVVSVPPALPEVLAHRQHIEQVFMNIINNARYALNQRYPAAHENKLLRVSAEETALDNHVYTRVTFCDHGCGVPAGILDRLMQPFFTTKPAGIGTGLGLSISYGIILAHEGRLNIESVEGEYTKIMVDLPVAGGLKI